MLDRLQLARFSFVALLLTGAMQFSVVLAAEATPSAIGAAAAPVALDAKTLSSEMAARLARVQEFRFIRQEAEKLGVRAWLFGGTAAGYGHYVKTDLERERGNQRYQPKRFDYHYTNIYRSTQDLDIVIDGTADKAQELQNILAQKYPHLQGSKSAWEVRLLTHDMGDKQALLNNPDFLNQHTDSNSTGMIEITQPAKGEPVVRDLRDWKSVEPEFLKDIRDGTIHYYYSPLHTTTKFYREGRNPPIFSAIRYLTKAVQYELKIRPDDLKNVEKVIQEFDRQKDIRTTYASGWIEKNGKKLIQNAVNVEYAVNLLDELGLRKKLAAVHSSPDVVDSLTWWMNKEPLRSKPVGLGTGRTAKELGLNVIAHETNNILAYEAITRAPTGEANVLISRPDVNGETAKHGQGFYAREGRVGARGTGLTVRFDVLPNAREHSDFEYNQGMILLHNRKAVRVVPESLNFSLLEYFEYLKSGSGFDGSDRGMLEMLRQRIATEVNAVSESDREKIIQMGLEELKSPHPKTAFLEEWLKLPFLPRDRIESALEHLLTGPGSDAKTAFATFFLPVKETPESAAKFETAKTFARLILNPEKQAYRTSHFSGLINASCDLLPYLPEPIRKKMQRLVDQYYLSHESAFYAPYFKQTSRKASPEAAELWRRFEQKVAQEIQNSGSGPEIDAWLQSPSSVDRPDLFKLAIEKMGKSYSRSAPPPALFESPYWAKSPLFERYMRPFVEAKRITSRHLDFLETPAARANPKMRKIVLTNIAEALRKPRVDSEIFGQLVHFSKQELTPGLEATLWRRMKTDSALAQEFFEILPNSKGRKATDPEIVNWMKWLIESGGKNLSGNALAAVLQNTQIQISGRTQDALFLEAIRRTSEETGNPSKLIYALNARMNAGQFPSFKVIQAFLETDWSVGLNPWELKWPIKWASEPFYRKNPKIVEFFPHLLGVADQASDESLRNQCSGDLKALLALEPFASDPRAEIWNHALEQRPGTWTEFLEAAEKPQPRPCARKFRELRAP